MANGTVINPNKEWITLLWTNPNPGNESGFAAQTIPLDLSDYDAVLVSFTTNINNAEHHCQLCIKGVTTTLFAQMSQAATDLRTRRTKVNNTGVEFVAGYKGTTVQNTSCVPRAIYGMKF